MGQANEGILGADDFFLYYIQRDETLIIMLGGGEKSTQSNDIAKAIKLSTLLEE